MKIHFGRFAPSDANSSIWASGRQSATGLKERKRKSKERILLNRKRPYSAIACSFFIVVLLQRIQHSQLVFLTGGRRTQDKKIH